MISDEKNTEQAILDAADKLFQERGFALTSTTDIAREVGCNQALIHYYFRTKDRLFEAFLEKKMNLFVSAFMIIGDKKLSFLEELEHKINVHFDLLRNNPRLPFVLLNELSVNPSRIRFVKEKLALLSSSVIKEQEKRMKEAIKQGQIKQTTTAELMLTIVSLNAVAFIAQPILKQLTGMSDQDFEILIDKRKKENVAMILGSLRP